MVGVKAGNSEGPSQMTPGKSLHLPPVRIVTALAGSVLCGMQQLRRPIAPVSEDLRRYSVNLS